MRLVALLLAMVLSFPAQAVALEPDPEVINWGGITFAWPKDHHKDYKVGDPLFVYDTVSARDDETLIEADCAKWSLPHKGATWCFASEKNLGTFKKSIDEDGDSLYEPVFGGRCTLGTAWGKRSPPGDPRTFEVMEYGGELRLVLQSHNRWKSVFREAQAENFARAKLAHNIFLSVGAIVPNSEIKKTK